MFARASSFRTKVLDKSKQPPEKVSFSVKGNFLLLYFERIVHNFVLVHKVVLPNAYLSDNTDQVNVSFERGGKTLTTSFQNVDPKNIEIDFNESMTIVSTMTSVISSQTNASYQAKPAKLIVRLKKEGKGSSMIGVANIDLAKYACAYAGTDVSLELEQCTVLGAMINATIVPTLLGSSDSTTGMDHSSHVASDEVCHTHPQRMHHSNDFMPCKCM
jgi:hypothetical protein